MRELLAICCLTAVAIGFVTASKSVHEDFHASGVQSETSAKVKTANDLIDRSKTDPNAFADYARDLESRRY